MNLEHITQELCMIQTKTGFEAIKYFWETYDTLESCKSLRDAEYDSCMQSKYETCMMRTYKALADYTMKKRGINNE